jgi:hypothetical protein
MVVIPACYSFCNCRCNRQWFEGGAGHEGRFRDHRYGMGRRRWNL